MKFQETCTVEAFNSYDSSGQATYSAGSTYACNIFEGITLVRDINGNNVPSRTHVEIPAVINYNDRITIDGESRIIANVSSIKDNSRKFLYSVVFLS